MATLTKKDLLEAIEDMPMDAVILTIEDRWVDAEEDPIEVEKYADVECRKDKNEILIC